MTEKLEKIKGQAKKALPKINPRIYRDLLLHIWKYKPTVSYTPKWMLSYIRPGPSLSLKSVIVYMLNDNEKYGILEYFKYFIVSRKYVPKVLSST